MNDICKYLEIVTEFAKRHLQTYFNFEALNFDDFEIVNSYLIYQSIKDKKTNTNTLIQLPDKKTKSQFYIPTIFILALYNFIDNFIDDETTYEVGNILQQNGIRYEIIRKNKNGFTLKGPNNAQYFPSKEQIRKYIITSADLKNQRVKTKFKFYKSFFNQVIKDELDYLPSKFKYKSVIITDKKIVDEIKKYEINGERTHKAFPFQYITKTGKTTDNIPIDPMIYIANDYETARNHILDKGIKIRNVAIIGANKYREHHLEISEDLNNNRFENCLLIGNSDISENAIPNLCKWNWTLPELDYFNYFETYPIEKVVVINEQFSQSLNDFNLTVTGIETEYGINLKGLYKFVRTLLPITLTSKESRLTSQIENTLAYFEKEGHDLAESAFYEIDEYDYEDSWENILTKFKALSNCKRGECSKFQKVKEFQKIDYLVVPKDYIEIWKEETKQRAFRNVISFKEFEALDKSNKTIVFLGFYGYAHLKSMLYSTNKIHNILYPSEKEHFDNCYNRFKKEIYNELKKSNRKTISEISFNETEQTEDVSELIQRLFEQSEGVKTNLDFASNYESHLTYFLTFEDDSESLELDENKAVLLNINGKEREEKVKNLKVADCIRVYDNSSKETLYQIALDADTESKFQDIERYSIFWKKKLIEYGSRFGTTEEFLQDLNEQSISITSDATLRSWANVDSRVKFPQSRKDLVVIKKLTNIEDCDFKEILNHRQAYNSIMIALGRDLSDEISDFIKQKKKGRILTQFSTKQIQKFVDQNAKERIIKSIKVSANEE